jgi:hypothetical protein
LKQGRRQHIISEEVEMTTRIDNPLRSLLSLPQPKIALSAVN